LEYLDFLVQHTPIGGEANEHHYIGPSLLRSTALYRLIQSGEDTAPATIARAEASLQAVWAEAKHWPRSLLAWKAAVLQNKLYATLGRSAEASAWQAQAQPIYAALCQSVPPGLLDTFQRGAETFIHE
jgi:hypothetical protein